MSEPKRPDNGPKQIVKDSTLSVGSRDQKAHPGYKIPEAPPLTEDKRDPMIGATFSNRYRIEEQIGEGGMGRIYLAENLMIGRKVAIKMLPIEYSVRSEFSDMFIQEARLATRIAHENIIDIIDMDLTPEGTPFYVMELLKGQDLASVLSKEHSLEWQRVLSIAVQLCRALGAAHDAGIVHRDMKPENIFLVERGDNRDHVKVFDFGIAKLLESAGDTAEGERSRASTNPGMVKGTPVYMSPEQTLGGKIDHRSDIYSVGIIMYELLCGRPPFINSSLLRVLEMHRSETPRPFSEIRPDMVFPEGVEAIVMKALAKNPDDRYSSINDMEGEIVKLLEGMGGAESPAKSLRKTPASSGASLSRPGSMGSRSQLAYEEIIKQEKSRSMRQKLVVTVAIAVVSVLTAIRITPYVERWLHNTGHVQSRPLQIIEDKKNEEREK